MSTPPWRIAPAVGRSRPAIMRRRLVLPAPVWPSTTLIVPGSSVRLTSIRWRSPPTVFETLSSESATLAPPPHDGHHGDRDRERPPQRGGGEPEPRHVDERGREQA